ncbi:SiaB family protein kinase [Pseudodesulfovibrio tunisiensis]|uniref:SiaB family protein kinase n=1 Tax=Pseudodesulfovibrio tunisiensis TaxID=463192 RepID=UPI001FB45DE4|nr:SiaB family protein kinase [Pseudodesulfovibrio tunisiensis]
MTPEMFGYYEKFQKDRAILYFNGPVSQGMVESFAELMREKMRFEVADRNVVHRVFAILVEQMQNIVRYSVDKSTDHTESNGEIALGQVVVGQEDDGRFFVACANRIAAKDGETLSKRIEKVRSMSKADLKVLYREQRRNGPAPDSKGAGLGFIDMARKAAGPMDFRIIPVDCDTSFFSMKVVA